MAKIALLIGVSEYQAGLSSLPGAVRDVEAMLRVLKHPDMGGFDDVKTLINPDPMVMQEAIEVLFSNLTKDDLALLFYSGHGVKDDSNKLHFATRLTRKNPKGDLVKATAVSASFVQEIMSCSHCKRLVILLDCCFSGAFAEGMTAKDDGSMDIQNQLGGEGRAVLTSSSSTQYSFEGQGSDLSVYTRYIVEGIETGAADTDNDGSISIDELHDYARKKVQEAAPAMKPKIYIVEEGFKIQLAKSPVGNSKLRYRKEVEYITYENNGEITFLDRELLNELSYQLRLSIEETTEIEVQVLKPYQERQENLKRYQRYFTQTIQTEYPLAKNTRNKLNRLLQMLQLREEDVVHIESSLLAQREIEDQHQVEQVATKEAERLFQYKFFQYKQRKLLSLLHELHKVLHSLNMDEANRVEQLEQLVQSDRFKVLVLGEFNRGKSTFINAILGDEILPAFVRPTTSIINEVKWGIDKRALLHFIQAEGGEKIPPQEIPIDQIEKYVVIGSDVSEILSNRYEKLELFWPLSFCRNGVEIIDSPGLNESEIRQEITVDHLSKKVDAVLFVFSCEAMGSKSELNVIDNLLVAAGHEDIFFICNKFDNISERDKEDVKYYAWDTLRYVAKYERIFFISARNALEGRIEHDVERVAKSGITQVEKELEKFLVNDRGQIKILRAAREAKNIVSSVLHVLPELPFMRSNLNELNSIQKQLEKVNSGLDGLISEVEYQIG
jgi:ribosome biogenesis GTPase A